MFRIPQWRDEVAHMPPGTASGSYQEPPINRLGSVRLPAELGVDLVVILDDEVNVALVLNLWVLELERKIESGKRLLLVCGRHLLVGFHLFNLLLQPRIGADIFLGLRLDAVHHYADIADDGVVFVEAGKAMLLGNAIELGDHLRIRRRISRQLFGDGAHLLLRSEHVVDLFLRQRDLLELHRTTDLRQRRMKRESAERSGKAGNTQRGEDGTEELTHGKLLVT